MCVTRPFAAICASALASLILTSAAHAQTVIYVDDDAPYGGDGAAWSTAYMYLQDALLVATAGDEIHVAGGTYKPDQDEAGIVTPGNRGETFELINGVAIMGGYAGLANAADPDQRDIGTYETILSGDLIGDDAPVPCLSGYGCGWYGSCIDGFCIERSYNEENSYHVLTAIGMGTTAVMDGLTIANGNANGSEADSDGAGMYSYDSATTINSCTFRENWADSNGGGIYTQYGSPSVTNCTLTTNGAGTGGGMYNYTNSPTMSDCDFVRNAAYSAGGVFNDNSNGSLTNCTFIENSAPHHGAGMYNALSDVTLTACIFSANHAGNQGGGVLNAASSPVLDGCIFSDNSAYEGGGMFSQLGIWSTDKSSPVLTNCTFSGNSADDGGGMYNRESSSTLTNCTFSKNSAYYHGGAMFSDYECSPTLTNCTFLGNAAGEKGGAIQNYYSSGTLTNCTFLANAAGLFGGGVRNSISTPTLTNCILWGNSDIHGFGIAAQISDAYDSLSEVTYSCVQDSVPHDGDILLGIGNIDTPPRFVDAEGPDGLPGTGDEDLRLLPRSPCIDAGDNAAVPQDIHDIDGDGDIEEPVPLDFAGATRFFDDPCVADSGNPDPSWPALGIVDMGAFEHQGDPPGDLDGDGAVGCEDNCPFHYNPDLADCDLDDVGDVCALALGASYDCQPEGEVGHGIPDECDIADDTSSDADGNGVPDECQTVYHVDDDAPPGGDGLTWTTAFKYLQDALSIAYCGDEIHIAAGTYTPDLDESGHFAPRDIEATFQLIHGVAVRGGHRGCPGGLCASGNPDERHIEIYETVLSGDLAGDDAEVPSARDLLEEPTRVENSNHVVTGSVMDGTAVLDGCTVTGGNAQGVWPHGGGGGMYNWSGSPTLTRCTFRENSAYEGGGGMFNLDGSSPTLADCTFLRNSGGLGGGGMYNDDNSSPMLTDCRFSENSAYHDYYSYFGGGGMLNNNSSSPTLTNCTFSENSATNAGGMYNYENSSPRLTDCTFTRNSANGRGGGMRNYRDSSPALTNCTFFENSAGSGAGVHTSGGSPTLTNCTFVRNSAGSQGGGMSNTFTAYATLVDCTFSENSANEGGGIYNSSKYLRLTNCTFSVNSAVEFGGGICNHDGDLRLVGCTFSENSTNGAGGGIYSKWYCIPSLINCTFSKNFAYEFGGGMCNIQHSRPRLIGCSFSGNTAGIDGGGMRNDDHSNPTLTNSTFSANSADANGGGMSNRNSSPTLVNCALSANSAGLAGGGMHNYATSYEHSDPRIYNSILWANTDMNGMGEPAQISDQDGAATSITYSLVQGLDSLANTGNIDGNPDFVDADGLDGIAGTEDDDLRLMAGSPAIDAADNAAVPEGVITDLDGEPRFIDDPDTPDTGNPGEPGPILDMGAYEYQATCGDGVLDSGEECEGAHDEACPGRCTPRGELRACRCEPTGACCDGITGVCTNGRYDDECVDEHLTWHESAECDSLEGGCDRVTGACCDVSPGLGGRCTDGALLEYCTGSHKEWFKDTVCVDVTCFEGTGACCDRTAIVGGCTDDVLAEECICNKCEWVKETACEEVDCVKNPIPTVSDWGLVVLTLLLLTGGKIAFGRRRLGNV